MTKFVRLTMSFAAFLFLLSSCSSDDSSDPPSESELVAGTYTLVELNIDPPQDINEDGNTTSNVLSELPCATGSLTINDDATWSWTFVEVNVTTITGGLFEISCTPNTFTSSGTWQVQNNLLTLFDGVNSVFFTVGTDRLTSTTGDSLPDFRSTVYEKQQ